MPSMSLGGALGGAATGAKIGSTAGPWGTAIGAGIGGLVGLFTGGKSKLQKNMENKIDPSMENLMHWSGQSRDKQNAMYNVAMPAFKASGKFYGDILSNPGSFDAFAGPQMTAINDQYQGMLNQGQYAARGGGRNMMMANAGFARNRALSEMTAQLRAEAAKQMMALGQASGSQALDWGSLSTNQAASVLNAATGGMAQGAQARQADQDAGWGAILEEFGGEFEGILGSLKDIFSGAGGKTATRPRIAPTATRPRIA